MVNAKHINIPLGGHFKPSKVQESKTEDEKTLMSKVSYASDVGTLMYAMVCTRQVLLKK